MPEVDNQVPSQETGAETNTSNSFAASSREAAIKKYEEVKQRLLDVNHWQDYAGKATASFELIDRYGNPTTEKPKQGFYFKIDIPGPGPATGKGYDWVKVECVEEEGSPSEEIQAITIRVRPSDNPTTSNDDTAHFYSSEATSNFMVKREGNTVIALVLGRNEKPNTNVSSIMDKARNAAVGAAASAGVSTIQWNQLVKGLISHKD